MKKMIFFVILASFAAIGFIVVNDSQTLNGYASKVGALIGFGQGYTIKTANAVQDSVRSSASAVDDLREGKAREIIEEQRKKIEEMRKELEQAMNSTSNAEKKDKSN